MQTYLLGSKDVFQCKVSCRFFLMNRKIMAFEGCLGNSVSVIKPESHFINDANWGQELNLWKMISEHKTIILFS